jgi:DNA-directed RNA polymerase specialized sigma24 family protein
MTTTTTTNHYVSNKELFAACSIYSAEHKKARDANEELPVVPHEIGSAILRICTNMTNNYNFVGYTYKEEMIADAILKCIIKAHNFDPTKSDNPFAFFSQICWNQFLERIKKENHQTSVKAKLIREKMSNEFVEHGSNLDDSESSNAFVEFLKENDALTDYYEEKKKKVHPSLVHRNKTAYPTAKEQVLKEPKEITVDIFEL